MRPKMYIASRTMSRLKAGDYIAPIDDGNDCLFEWKRRKVCYDVSSIA